MRKPRKYTPQDWEYIDLIAHIMENVLKLDKKIIITTDKDHFDSYMDSAKWTIKHNMYGACIRESGLVFLNEKKMALEERALTVAVLIHEILHVKYPYKRENEIGKLTDYYLKIYYGNM